MVLKIMEAKTTPENIQTEHNSLGHPGKSVMCELTRKGKIPNFQTIDIDDVISLCSTCKGE
jgi:hypothetical protein